MHGFEAEIYRGVFEARKNKIQHVLDLFFHQHMNFGSTVETKVEHNENRQVWYGEFKSEEGSLIKRIYGYIDLQPTSSEEQSIEVRIICCFEPLLLFWEDLAHELRTNYWMGYLKPDAPYFPGFNIPLKNILSTNSRVFNYGRKPGQSDHYAYPNPKDREKIVIEYRKEHNAGRVKNKELWAMIRYHISARTLFEYEREFPEVA